MRTYYIYRHVSHDTGMPFYIGMSTCNEWGKTYKMTYRRAFCDGATKKNRGEEWKEVALKGYDVDILFESDSRYIIEQKEMEFIALYGRMDLGTGTLVNRTAGGYGQRGISKELKKSISKKKQETGVFDRVGEINSKPLFLYGMDGAFIRVLKSRRECAKEFQCNEGNFDKAINNKRSYRGYYITRQYEGEKLDLTNYKKAEAQKMCVAKCDNNGNIISAYHSIYSAAEKNNINKNMMWDAVCVNRKVGGYTWRREPFLKVKHLIA